MTISNSIATASFHFTIDKAHEQEINRYLKLWKEIQEFGNTTIGKSEEERRHLYFERFGFRLESSRLIITLLTCCDIEGMANFYIATKTDEKKFAILENASLLDKWVTIPRFFCPEYELPKDGQLYQDLKLLITERNSIVHPKPVINIDDNKVHKGNMPKRKTDEHEFTHRNAKLPLRLMQNLWKYDQSQEVRLLLFSSGYDKKKFENL
jgi:hypothetical protein